MTVYHEFYSPFAHLPGRYEWCRIHSATHGAFACFIVIHTTTADPVTVYVSAAAGERFMHDRFPESETIVVDPEDLLLHADEVSGVRAVSGTLHAASGPVRDAHMYFTAPADTVPRATPYGGGAFAVWGSRWTCEGVDLELDARLEGFVTPADDMRTDVSGQEAIVTVAGYGRLWER